MKAPDFAATLPALTLQPDKVRLYQEDFVVLEGWRSIWASWGERSPEFIYRHTFLLLKPETVARRLSCAALRFVAERGFDPVGWISIRLTRNAAHHIWRFQWNAATTDRVELTNRCNAQGDCLMIVLRERHPDAVPASVKVWRLKGSAHADRRTDAHLRTALRMHNRMLGFVHSPDEPADLVRDLSILFEPAELRSLLLTCINAPKRSSAALLRDALAWVCRQEKAWPAHSVHPEEVLARLSQQTALAPLKDAIADARRTSLEEVLRYFRLAGADERSWDSLTIAAELIPHDLRGVAAMLDAKAIGEMYTCWSRVGELIQKDLLRECHA